MTKSKKTKSKPKTTAPNYIHVNGHYYEKMASHCENLEFELSADVVDSLQKLVDSGKFTSIGDAVRHILREML